MLTAQNSVIIKRPVARVFEFVSDGESAPKWRKGVVYIKKESGEHFGAVYRQRVKGPGGRHVKADYVVTAYVPGRQLAFRAIAGPVRPEGEFKFEPEGDGTRLTFALKAEVNGMQRLLAPLVRKTMQAEVKAIERIEALIQS